MLIQWSYSSSWPTASSDWAPRLEELLTKDRGAPLLCLLLVHLKCVPMNTKALLRTHQVNSLQLILDGCFALRAGGASPCACVCVYVPWHYYVIAITGSFALKMSHI